MLIRLTPTNTNDDPVDIKVDLGPPIKPDVNCTHEMKYRLVRMRELLKVDPVGVTINVCDYCGADLNNPDVRLSPKEGLSDHE